MDTSAKAIVAHNLAKDYREHSGHPIRALDGLSLEVTAGEIFGLLGPNGAGKTTLLRIFTTLVRPTSGSASVLGFDVARHPLEVRRRICVVLQEYAAEIHLSVEDNLVTYARFQSVPSGELRSRMDRVIVQFGLGDVLRQKVADLSGGLKRRVQVAKVFMVDRPVVFLDEPTTGMDPLNKRATLDAIRAEARSGRTVFLTTHILQEAEELCDTIAIIDRGRGIALGSIESLKALSAGTLDITLTFRQLDDTILSRLRSLPLADLSWKHSTVRLHVRGNPSAALETIGNLAAGGKILHVEANGTTLEDVFLSLVSDTPAGRPGPEGAP